jgi:uncharacterized protein YbjT (DUF2867 family)
MKVVVTGATGNAGTSVVGALSGASEIERMVGFARPRSSGVLRRAGDGPWDAGSGESAKCPDAET